MHMHEWKGLETSTLARAWFLCPPNPEFLDCGKCYPKTDRAINYIDGTIFSEIQLLSFKSNYNLCGLQLIAH